MHLLRYVLVAVALFTSAERLIAQHATPQQQAEAELLAIHQQDRRAHLERNVDLLLQDAGRQTLDVRDGKIRLLTSAELRQRFADYFRRVRFSAWNDVEPPVVHASKDGHMGWMIVRVHIAYAEPEPSGKPTMHDETMAWMSAYEKCNGKWIMTAVTSTSDAER